MHKTALILVISAVIMASACDPARPNRVAEVNNMTGGDLHRGQEKIHQYGCNTCHTIPGITGPEALVGPPLIHWSKRIYIAGELPNTPDNLRKWIQHPPQIEPKTAMPDMGVTEQDSRDISAYLYSID